MVVSNIALIKKALKALGIVSEQVLSSRVGNNWVVFVTIAGEKILYYLTGSTPPKADYKKTIRGKKGAS